MNRKAITNEQFEHLPELHRLVIEQKIKKGEWILVESVEEAIKTKLERTT